MTDYLRKTNKRSMQHNELARYYSTQAHLSTIDNQLQSISYNKNNHHDSCNVLPAEIRKVIRHVNNNKAPDSDYLNTDLIKAI